MTQTRIKSLHAFHLKIRLKKPVRHASYQRTVNDTLVVRCELTDGSIGWGESLPRPYVTGETIETAFSQLLNSNFESLADCDASSAVNVMKAVSQWHPAADLSNKAAPGNSGFGNSVRCAIELALLDAAARAADVSASHVIRELAEPLGLNRECSSVRYSGVITSSTSGIAQFRSALKMRIFGFESVKLKVGHPDICDRKLAARTRRIIGSKIDLRIDANEAWQPEEAELKIRELQPFGISCVEQPIPDTHRSYLPELRRDTNVPIMLDESVCSIADAQQAIKEQSCDAFNVRISKCGGILNCLQIIKLANANGLFYQLGCLVGETGILSAAGRHLACSILPARFYEGSYDRFVVRDRLTRQDLTFGYGGKASAIGGPGFGIDVSEADVAKLTQRTHRCL